MKAWNPILDPVWVIFFLFAIAGSFIPMGFKFRAISNNVVEYKFKYDSYEEGILGDCGIDEANEGMNNNKTCTIDFVVTDDMKGPVMVYIEIENFYQNHRAYETSRDDKQVSLIGCRCTY